MEPDLKELKKQGRGHPGWGATLLQGTEADTQTHKQHSTASTAPSKYNYIT